MDDLVRYESAVRKLDLSRTESGLPEDRTRILSEVKASAGIKAMQGSVQVGRCGRGRSRVVCTVQACGSVRRGSAERRRSKWGQVLASRGWSAGGAGTLTGVGLNLNRTSRLASPRLSSHLALSLVSPRLVSLHLDLPGCAGRTDAVGTGGAEVARRTAGRCTVLRAAAAGMGSVDFLPDVRRWAQGSAIRHHTFTPICSSIALHSGPNPT